MNKNLKNYNQPILFYTLATILPWSFWFASAYISRLTPSSISYINIASILGFIGLLTPMLVAFWLMQKNENLRRDLWGRFGNFSTIRPLYLFLALFLMLGSILLAQAISLLFGHRSQQVLTTLMTKM